MKNDLPIDPNRVHYPKEKTFNIIPNIRTGHYKKSNEYREIIIFCSSLVENMNWKLKLKFWWKGKYYKALIKTYDELLKKKSKRELMRLKPDGWSDIDNYHATGTRGKMMKLCSNLLSQMSRFNRFRFTYLLQYHKALYKTDQINRKKISKRLSKDLKRNIKKRRK